MPTKLRADQRDALAIVLEDDLLELVKDSYTLRLFQEWMRAPTMEDRERLYYEALACKGMISALRKAGRNLIGENNGGS